MKIFNTLSRRKEEFVPIEEGKVRMYVCGPTVYNLIHIGNARPMIFFDTVRRYFEYRGYKVNYVSNFTDVDDKIINKAIEEGVDAAVISQRYIDECKKDMAAMNVLPATKNPLATQEIGGMEDMIGELIESGHAYVAKDGTVYFRVKSFKDYGKLSHKNIDELQSGFREIKVTGEDGKEDSNDFVLWKPKKDGEPFWDSPWSKGRPGWHIECSVMSKKYLGDQIDIHGGGEDLIFPHHENEIAQSEGRSGKEFAHYWLHNGYININNQKMSKSLNNFFTVREISEVIDLEIVRFFLLSAQYRNPVNFSQDLLDAAKSGMERLYNTKHKVEFLLEQAQGMIKEDEKEFVSKLPSYRELFIEAMDDDLNTADGISAIFELSKFINTTVSEKSSKEYLQECMNIFCELTNVLNIIQKKKSDGFDEDKINELIEQRSLAKKEKNFAEADRIRGQLHDMGVEVLDTRQGTTWKKID